MYLRTLEPASEGLFTAPDPIGFSGGSMNFYEAFSSNPLIYTDSLGLRVITGPYVLDPALIKRLEQVNKVFPGEDVIVTGGNRYRDADGNIRSSTTNEIISNSAPYSKHLAGEAVDFKVTNTPDVLSADAASRVFDWVKYGYDNPHVHADIGGTGADRSVCK